MKKLFVAILFLASLKTTAQHKLIDKLSIGVNLGGNNSLFLPLTLTGTSQARIDVEYGRTHSKTSLRGGAGLTYQINDRLSAMLHVNYEKKGWYRDSLLFVNPFTSNFKIFTADFYFHFISFPVIFQYEMGKKIKWYPRLGFVMSMPLSVTGRGIYIESDERLIPLIDFSPSANRSPNVYWDKAILAGLAFKVPYRAVNLGFSVNYQASLNLSLGLLQELKSVFSKLSGFFKPNHPQTVSILLSPILFCARRTRISACKIVKKEKRVKIAPPPVSTALAHVTHVRKGGFFLQVFTIWGFNFFNAFNQCKIVEMGVTLRRFVKK